MSEESPGLLLLTLLGLFAVAIALGLLGAAVRIQRFLTVRRVAALV
jgi:hypothetical protein